MRYCESGVTLGFPSTIGYLYQRCTRPASFKKTKRLLINVMFFFPEGIEVLLVWWTSEWFRVHPTFWIDLRMRTMGVDPLPLESAKGLRLIRGQHSNMLPYTLKYLTWVGMVRSGHVLRETHLRLLFSCRSFLLSLGCSSSCFPNTL